MNGNFDKKIPRLAPRPLPCETMRQNVLCLDGTWEFRHQGEDQSWHLTEVPSCIGTFADEAQGFCGKYSYRKNLEILPWQADCVKLLNFEGINGYARVLIDGELVAEHWNGFLTWQTDITKACEGKERVCLQIDVDETVDRVGSFYHGGILHSIFLYLLPKTYLSMVQVSTALTERNDAVLSLYYTVEAGLDGCEIQGILMDPWGKEVPEGAFCKKTEGTSEDARVDLPIPAPLLWDAEHPWLYTMQLCVCRDGAVLERTNRTFGFRQITRRENQVFVNGQEVKLHGVCRHEISPLHGRCLTKELIDRDVRLFKEANCNYIRTSHYPPSEYFLEACDREGIYVEDELGLAFIAKSTPYTQRDPGETERYLSHFRETMARDYSHPCVIIWSLCNESFGGCNFDVLNRYIHKTDPGRLTKFSYPMTMQLSHEPVDVWSIHYSNLNIDLSEKRDNVSVGIMEGKDVPVVHDEYAHIPCYNREELRRDPNVRNFWGNSIKAFWDRIWNTKGALGGAIWAGIDETNVFNGGLTQLEWGILDVWRRRKPEFYLVRKAYSPIVVDTEHIKWDEELEIPVENRFCHTDLSETVVYWKAEGLEGRTAGPKAAPRETGILRLRGIPRQGSVSLTWRDAFGKCVDEYLLTCPDASGSEESLSAERTEPSVSESSAGEACAEAKNAAGTRPDSGNTAEREWQVSRTEEQVRISGKDCSLCFSTETGKIVSGVSLGQEVLAGGPDLHMSGINLGPWKKTEFTVTEGATPRIFLRGWYGQEAEVSFVMTFEPEGKIRTAYRIEKLAVSMPDRIKLRVSVTPGGLNEIGIRFTAAAGMDALSWKRQGEWTIYPKDHIGRNQGTAYRFSKGSRFGMEPQIPWKDEMESWILNGKYDVDYKGTNDFRSQKEHILRASLFRAEDGAGIRVLSDGSHSVRAEIQEPEASLVWADDARISYTGEWYQETDAKCGADYREMWSKTPGSAAEILFEGTGIVWYGPVDVIYGYARVFLDGRLVDGRVDQRVNSVDFPGSADGYDKKYHYPVFSVNGLEKGKHILRIEPVGFGNPEAKDSYIVIEGFRILDGTRPEPASLLINNQVNYPMISWGNYRRHAILPGEGYENQAVICLGRKETGEKDAV